MMLFDLINTFMLHLFKTHPTHPSSLNAYLFNSSKFKISPLTLSCFFCSTVLAPEKFGEAANFSTFLLDRSSGMLFLGARDALLCVDTKDLDKPPRKVGTLYLIRRE